MRYNIDVAAGKITVDSEEASNAPVEKSLYSAEGFELLNQLWLTTGWNQKYSYRYTWLGRPIIQLPEDMLSVQQVVWDLKPDVIIETGIAHGGSLIYYASLCQLMGKGKVVGVDIEIRPHNREAVEGHPLFDYISLIEGSSTDEAILEQVKSHIAPNDVVLVILDSNHTKQHVLDELRAYHPLVTVGSYIVATDGVMKDLTHVPNGDSTWIQDNPVAAVETFLAENDAFVFENPLPEFNESAVNTESVPTYWPKGWLKRVK